MTDQQSSTKPGVLELVLRKTTLTDTGQRWSAETPDGTIVERSSRTPIAAGARGLLKMGLADPDDLMTARHEWRDLPSFKPMPVKTWAGRAYADGGPTVERFRWEPHPKAGEADRALHALLTEVGAWDTDSSSGVRGKN